MASYLFLVALCFLFIFFFEAATQAQESDDEGRRPARFSRAWPAEHVRCALSMYSVDTQCTATVVPHPRGWSGYARRTAVYLVPVYINPQRNTRYTSSCATASRNIKHTKTPPKYHSLSMICLWYTREELLLLTPVGVLLGTRVYSFFYVVVKLYIIRYHVGIELRVRVLLCHCLFSTMICMCSVLCIWEVGGQSCKQTFTLKTLERHMSELLVQQYSSYRSLVVVCASRAYCIPGTRYLVSLYQVSLRRSFVTTELASTLYED